MSLLCVYIIDECLVLIDFMTVKLQLKSTQVHLDYRARSFQNLSSNLDDADGALSKTKIDSDYYFSSMRQLKNRRHFASTLLIVV